MIRILLFMMLTFALSVNINAQSETMIDTTYETIPTYPEDFTPGSIMSRMIDGLGYRYHWATRDLRMEDLEYRPSEDGKTCLETLDHLLGLSEGVLNSIEGKPNVRPVERDSLSFDEMRTLTMANLRQASKSVIGKSEEEIAELKIVFQRKDKSSEFPIWHLLNGFMADAIYHVGQIVVFRRASGNPMDPTVNVFMGKNR